MYLNQNDIALKTIEQLRSHTKSDLAYFCKEIGIKGYSKLRKEELVQFVYEQYSNIRAVLINTIEKQEAVEQKQLAIQEANAIEDAQASKRVDSGTIEYLTITAKSYKNPPVENIYRHIAESVLAIYEREGYSINYILTDLTKQFYKAVKEYKGSDKDKDLFYEACRREWILLMRPFRSANNEISFYKKLQYDSKPEIELGDATEDVVQWAITNLKSDNYKSVGTAISILTGRRRGEVFGTTTFTVKDGMIYCEGLLKKATREESKAIIVPLYDPQAIVDAVNELEEYGYRGLTKNQLRENISKCFGKSESRYLKDIGFQNYHKTRDFYAAYCHEAFTLVGIHRAYLITSKTMAHKSLDTTEHYNKFGVKPVLSEELAERMTTYYKMAMSRSSFLRAK